MATAVLGIGSAALLGGVLQAGLHRALKLRQPEFAIATPLRAPAPDGRSDRLPSRPVQRVAAARPSPIITQQLQSTGLGDKPLTVLVADLAHMSALQAAPEAPAPGVAQGGDSHDRSAPRGPALPPLIAFGSPAPPAASTASFYAPASGATAWTEPGPAGTAVNVTIQPGSPAEVPDRESIIVAQRGDTLDRVMGSFGVTAANVGDLAGALGVDKLGGGERLVVRQSAEQLPSDGERPVKVRLERTDGTVRFAALSDDGRYRPVEMPGTGAPASGPQPAGHAAPSEDEDVDDASLRDGLIALAGHEGVGRTLVTNIIRVLGTDLDLGEGVSADDRIQILYDADADGAGDQDLDYAALTSGGKTTRLYRFATADDNSVDYYDEAGHSLSKFLLRKPVAAGRIGDGFGWRIHPILGDRRFHEGVDYAAPFGSPIVAAGAGTVEKIDFESGYGKYIRIRHDLGYETTYAHVAGYPRGIAVGKRVQQGDTIALIGSTGLSTGPHLYYEVKINGRNVDPTRIRIAAGRILEGAALAAFQRRRARIDVLLKASRLNNS